MYLVNLYGDSGLPISASTLGSPGSRHAPERRLVQHEFHRTARPATGRERADVPLDESKVHPLALTDRVPHLRQVASISRGKVVQPDRQLAQFEQALEQMGADKPCHAGD